MPITPRIAEFNPNDLTEPPDNPNHMTEQRYALLVKGIREEGFLQPVLARETAHGVTIVDGCHRTRAAIEVGLKSIPVVVIPEGYPEAKARLLQLGLNKLRGDLNLTEVAHALEELQGSGVDLELSGYTHTEISDVLDAIKPLDPDDLLRDAGAAMGEDGGGDKPEPEGFPVEVVLPTAKAAKAAKKRLKTLGGGDLGKGLMVALEMDE